MGNILREMTVEEQSWYDGDAKEHPWLKEDTLSDDEVRERLDHYHHPGYTDERLAPALEDFRMHYGWVYLAMIRHFLATGEMVSYDKGYMDGQFDGDAEDIMKSDGAPLQTIIDVFNRKAKYQFKWQGDSENEYSMLLQTNVDTNM